MISTSAVAWSSLEASWPEYVRATPCCKPCNISRYASLRVMQNLKERMMTVDGTTPARSPSSLRERKKLATRRSLRRAVIDLTAERGFAHVTVEDIAQAADVSVRTFFNYFPSKEAALFGTDPQEAAALPGRVAREAHGEPVLHALRSVLADGVRSRAGELTELWLNQGKVLRTDPHLRAAQAAQMASLERALAEGIAERLGTDPEQDPYPGLLAAVAAGAFRSSLTFWAASGGTVPPDQVIDLAFQALADGLPERCALRELTANQSAKDEH
jgi:AcrR family transcriptional regulator